MINSTITVKVTLEVIVPVEQYEDDPLPPAEVALADLKRVSIAQWWERLSAEYEILDMVVENSFSAGLVVKKK